MTYIGTTINGLEKAAEIETSGKRLFEGRVSFSKLPKNPLTLDTVYELKNSFEFSDLDDLLNKVKRTKLGIEGTYISMCIRDGEQDFNSITIEQEAGKAIRIENRIEYTRDSPKNTIVFDIVGNNCLIGLLIKKDLSKRDYRFKLNNQTLPPLIASCLIKYLKIKDSLLCLECKDGIIPIEASLQGVKDITAVDINKNNIRNAKINSKLAKKEINFLTASINDLDIKSQEFMITHLVYSKEKREPYNLIHDTFELANNILKKDFAIITNHPEDMETFCPKTMKLKEHLKIKHKGAELSILIYSRS